MSVDHRRAGLPLKPVSVGARAFKSKNVNIFYTRTAESTRNARAFNKTVCGLKTIDATNKK